ncbi:serine O-acetyltransferase EpsC [Crystallibacter degradans]|uniref:serine O-acetyltransferase EpsC n=1 Tax=Crystallibacter degradans TaxID=2726743 RepID=UPI003211D613
MARNSLPALLREDLKAARAQDPAANSDLEVGFAYSGVHAVWAHRIAHAMWNRPHLRTGARLLSQFARFLTGIEIHPAATLGRRVFIDHGTKIVIGETAVIGDDVMMYQGVTLGGRALDRTKRHPTIGNRVMLGSGCRILGPVTVGDDSAIGANAVVVTDIPANSVAIGVPARWRHKDGSYPLDPRLDLIDPAFLL